MGNRSKLKAVVIFSDSNLFLVRCLIIIQEINPQCFIERVHGIHDLSNCLWEFVIEKHEKALVIINNNVKGDLMIESFRELDKFKNKIELNIIQLGMENFENLVAFLWE